jgi:hypothetical protein
MLIREIQKFCDSEKLQRWTFQNMCDTSPSSSGSIHKVRSESVSQPVSHENTNYKTKN